MTISIIAAVAKNRAIGFENKLIYWLPNDLKRFKALTTGHTIVMGRNTFESLPKGALPNRRNVVLSTTVKELPGCEVFPTLDAALQSCQPDEDIYIIGGARVYEQAISKADRLCLTEVDDIPAQADTFFPDYSDLSTKKRIQRTNVTPLNTPLRITSEPANGSLFISAPLPRVH